MFEFDPQSHELHEDPYPVYRKLRDEHPVLFNEKQRVWAISRWDDVVDALKRPHTFTSTREEQPRERADPSQTMPMMITMDPPGHDDLRGLVNKAFTPRRIAELEVRVREIARELVDGFIERGHCDLYADLAGPLPTTVIAAMLGVPQEDHEMFKQKSTELVAAAGPVGDQEGVKAGFELAAYLAGVLDHKRKHPADDLLSELLEVEMNGRKLTQGELVGFALLLLVAGNETTTNLISNGTLLLDRHPDQRRRLAADPSLVPVAIEEFLRCESPVQGLERRLSEDFELRGQRLRAGDKAFLLVASANRDERRVADPERFDVGRQPNRHLAFGWGTHFCLGAALARLEARAAWDEIIGRFPEFHISGPVVRLHSEVIRGLLKVPLEFEVRP